MCIADTASGWSWPFLRCLEARGKDGEDGEEELQALMVILERKTKPNRS